MLNISVCIFVADNLLIGERGELKIGDFGHARQMVDGVAACEGMSGIDGTVFYMAPEVSWTPLFFSERSREFRRFYSRSDSRETRQ